MLRGAATAHCGLKDPPRHLIKLGFRAIALVWNFRLPSPGPSHNTGWWYRITQE